MINYENIVVAQKYYSSKGFHKIEVPWFVSSGISNITIPKFSQPDVCEAVPIASGEQGFLELFAKGNLVDGMLYQTTTPCFRNNDVTDETHLKQFMKTELFAGFRDIVWYGRLTDTLKLFLDVAKNLYIKGLGVDGESLSVVPSEDFSNCCYAINHRAFDIEINGIEVGSYGIRKCKFGTWVYGTGLAEPRFSQAIGEK